MSRSTTIGTCWTGKYFGQIISVNHGMILVREARTGREEELPFTSVRDVWPANSTLETFDELAKAFDVRYAHRLIVAFTQTPAWADVIRSKWSDLY